MSLDSFLKHEGVLAVLLIKDGTVQKEAGSPGADTGMLAASLTLLMRESGQVAKRLGTGPPSTVFLEFGDRLLLVEAKGEGQLLAVITVPGAPLGRLCYRLRRELVGGGA
jgi:predicted regulator of Ras-like GTPase activity (Roadblock/LC7/MglB family)